MEVNSLLARGGDAFRDGAVKEFQRSLKASGDVDAAAKRSLALETVARGYERLARTAFDAGQQSATHEITWGRRVKEAQLDPGAGQKLLKVVNNESPMVNLERMAKVAYDDFSEFARKKVWGILGTLDEMMAREHLKALMSFDFTTDITGDVSTAVANVLQVVGTYELVYKDVHPGSTLMQMLYSLRSQAAGKPTASVVLRIVSELDEAAYQAADDAGARSELLKTIARRVIADSQIVAAAKAGKSATKAAEVKKAAAAAVSGHSENNGGAGNGAGAGKHRGDKGADGRSNDKGRHLFCRECRASGHTMFDHQNVICNVCGEAAPGHSAERCPRGHNKGEKPRAELGPVVQRKEPDGGGAGINRASKYVKASSSKGPRAGSCGWHMGAGQKKQGPESMAVPAPARRAEGPGTRASVPGAGTVAAVSAGLEVAATRAEPEASGVHTAASVLAEWGYDQPEPVTTPLDAEVVGQPRVEALAPVTAAAEAQSQKEAPAARPELATVPVQASFPGHSGATGSAEEATEALTVRAFVNGKEAGVGLDTCTTHTLVEESLTEGLQRELGQSLRVGGFGGGSATATETVVFPVKLPTGRLEWIRGWVVPDGSVPLPGVQVLVNRGTLQQWGLQLESGGRVWIGGLLCSGLASVRNSMSMAVSGAGAPFRAGSRARRLRALFGGAQQQFYVPEDSTAWREAVEAGIVAVQRESGLERQAAAVARVMDLAVSLGRPPEALSLIEGKARPCVQSQLRERFGPDAMLQQNPLQVRHRPPSLEPTSVSAAAYTGRSSSMQSFQHAYANTAQPTPSSQLFGEVDEVDLQTGIDFDKFCVPELEARPDWEEGYFKYVSGEAQWFKQEARSAFRELMMEDRVKRVFSESLDKGFTAGQLRLQPVKIGLRPGAPQRHEPPRHWHEEDIKWAKKTEDALISAGLVVPLPQGVVPQYISNPVIPKKLLPDGQIKRRYTLNSAPTINQDIEIIKTFAPDMEIWKLEDHNVLIWSVLDGLMWFFQRALDKASQPLTACRLVSRGGLWMYTGMSMGITTSPFHCQAGNAAMFWPMERDEFRSAVDEFVCMSRRQNEYETADDLEVQLRHVRVLRKFLYLLGDHGGRVSFPKAQLCRKHVRLYGLVWGNGLIRKPKDETQAILEWPEPSGRGQRKQLLSTVCAWQWLAGQGMATEFTEKTRKMREMANRKGPWRADEFEECRGEFYAMRQELAENIGVNMVRPDLRKVVSGDWSARSSLAGVLSQIYPDGTQRPCAVYSRKCTLAESRLKSAEGELLTMATSIERWGSILIYSWFWYIGDQDSLTELTEFLADESKPKNWFMNNLIRQVKRFQFFVLARNGADMPLEDALSRVKSLSVADVGSDGVEDAAKLTSTGFLQGGAAAVQGRSRWLAGADLFNAYMKKPGSDSLLPEPEICLPWHSRQGEALSALVATEQVEPETAARAGAQKGLSAAVRLAGTHAAEQVDDSDPRLYAVMGAAFNFDELMKACPEMRALRRLMQGEALKTVLSDFDPKGDFAVACKSYKETDPQFKKFYEEGGRIYHVAGDKEGLERIQLVVPTSGPDVQLRERLLFKAHDAVGHGKLRQTLDRLYGHYYWVGSAARARLWLTGCPCTLKRKNRRPVGALGEIPVGELFEKVHFDLLEISVLGKYGGSRYMITMNWPFSGRWAVDAIPKKDTMLIAEKLLIHTVLRRPQAPRVYVCDNAAEFRSAVMQDFAKILQARMNFTAAYNPQGNAYGERQHGPIASLVNMFLHGRSKDEWDDPFVIEALNYVGGTYPSSSRGGLSPSFIESGVDVLDPLDWQLSGGGPTLPPSDLANRLSMLHRMRRIVAQVHQQARNVGAQGHDKRAGPHRFKLGDRVWIHTEGKATDGAGKIGDKLMGPYEVLEWRQPQQRTAWLRNVHDHKDVISSPVDFWKLEKEVPEEMRLSYKPLQFANSTANDWVSGAGTYLEEMLARRDGGDHGKGPSFVPEELDELAEEDQPAELVPREASSRVAQREEEPEVFEVDKIKDHVDVELAGGVIDRDYLVCWKGFLSANEDRWVPREELLGSAADAVRKYEAQLTHAQRFSTVQSKKGKEKGKK